MWIDQIKRSSVKEEKEQEVDGNKVKQTIIRRFTVVPMRKSALERVNKMVKFGEVASIPRGQHRQGDFQKSQKPVFLDIDEGIGEDQLADQVKNLSSDQIKRNRLLEESKKEEMGSGATAAAEKKKRTVGDLKFDHIDRFSVRVSNILHTGSDENFNEFVTRLKSFLEEVLKENSKKVKKWGFKRDRKNEARHAPFMFLEFDDKDVAEEVERVLNGEAYFDRVQLSASVSLMKGLRN